MRWFCRPQENPEDADHFLFLPETLRSIAKKVGARALRCSKEPNKKKVGKIKRKQVKIIPGPARRLDHEMVRLIACSSPAGRPSPGDASLVETIHLDQSHTRAAVVTGDDGGVRSRGQGGDDG